MLVVTGWVYGRVFSWWEVVAMFKWAALAGVGALVWMAWEITRWPPTYRHSMGANDGGN